MDSSGQRECPGKTDGKKKVMGKKRKSKEYILRKTWRLIAFSNPASFSSHHKNSPVRKIQDTADLVLSGWFCLQHSPWGPSVFPMIGV
jgi:hypothetical protein